MDTKPFRSVNIDVEGASKAASELQNTELQTIAQSFASNTLNLVHLLFLPMFFLVSALADVRRQAFFAKAIVSTGNIGKWSKSEKAHQEVEAEILRLEEEFRRDKKAVSEEHNQAEARLDTFLKLEGLQSGLRALLYAVVANAWTCFESAAKDIWIAGLNARPLSLGQPAFRSVEVDADQTGLSRKAVPVGLLARHGFNISTCLGTILSEKFDFTGGSGIKEAYRAAFGVSSAAQLDTILTSDLLSHLYMTT
jgi:hypothetical protein